MAEKNITSNGIHHSKGSIEAQEPCFKHSAENLSQISKPDASSETALCNGCSKTMLSYIFRIQDMLDGLARKLSKNEVPNCCVQCLRQESRHIENVPHVKNVKNNDLKNENLVNSNGIANNEREQLSPVSTVLVNDEREPLSPVSTVSEPQGEVQVNEKLEKDTSPTVTTTAEVTSEPKRRRKVSSRRNSRRLSREIKNGNSVFSENCANRNNWQTDFLYNVSPKIEPEYIPYKQQQENKNLSSNSLDSSPLTPNPPTLFFNNSEPPPMADSEKSSGHSNFNEPNIDGSTRFDYSATESSSNYPKSEAKPDDFISGITLNQTEVEVDNSVKSDYSYTESNSSHFEADVDDSSKSDYSGTESLEREVDDISMEPAKNEKTTDQNVENWRTLHDSFSGRVVDKDRKCLEAFVTICRNNAEALGCLVLGSSLLLSRTSRKLCVLVFDDVDPVFKESLSSIFHVVQHVRHLKSVDESDLDYLKEKNLEKLNIWNLVQFSKCVFLNPDCLILRNCDDLFQHEELSAVPDIGWPDCFNAGVFVFAPSIKTLSELVELSQKQGQNNEGDQMLLNTYFDSWSSDIGNKLSFIYNLKRNASYTYGPALQRFGHNVKIVQFLGGSKPWEVKFFTQTGQLDGDVDVHPKHVRFFSEWINTFKIAVMKLFPQDVYSYAFNQRSISAEDIGFALCFSAPCKGFAQNSVEPFHIVPKRRMVPPFYLAAPSPRKATEWDTSVPTSDQPSDVHSIEEATQKVIVSLLNGKRDETQNGKMENDTILSESIFPRCLPGAIIGDYQGMKAWEQGQMDYEGCDSSQNILNRLSFLIHQSV